MTLAKIDLTNFAIVEIPARFPLPGVLKGRSDSDRAAILDDPGAFFGPPRPVAGRAGPAIIADPCPAGLRGFAWWPVIDTMPTPGPLQVPGPVSHRVDRAGRRVTAAASPLALTDADLAAHFGALEEELHRRINDGAEARRLDFITSGAGQALTYQAKAAEAAAIAGGATAAHPFVWAEALALGVGAETRAAAILAARDRWTAAGAAIEAARHKARMAVTAATDGRDPAALATMERAATVDWAAIGAG